MPSPYPRDLIGYGATPPHPRWPGEARIAVNFVVNYEEGSEYSYDSDAYNDELPYWTEVDGRPHLVVPYSLGPNDSKFGGGGLFTADDYFTFVKDGFDVLYREGRTQPKMMSIGLHMRLIGHPSRIGGLERVIDYMRGHAGVWICRRIDIARHWMATHPSPGPARRPGRAVRAGGARAGGAGRARAGSGGDRLGPRSRRARA